MKTAHRALALCSACEAQGFASTPCKYGCHEIPFVADPPARDHACDACGGSGVIRTVEDYGFYHTTIVNGCETCHGAGRISDVMPVADALADAETLQVVTGRIIGREPFNWVEARRFAHTALRAVPGLRGE